MFQRATPKGALVLKSVLSLYEKVLDQKVSLAKYAVYFSKHVQWGDCDILAKMLGMTLSYGKEKYLGLPYLVKEQRMKILIILEK